ncbi:hypothetical protein KS527_004565 [Salmonella enterica]|nr:hypothetical protein [Salmonella enterica]EHQ9605800.1 hypothetical protein [Salmonella enterica]EJF7575650.1 hypothetical protein [Salmonella enterica subsp. enterica]
MAKATPKTEEAVAAVEAAPERFPVTLTEFCRVLSLTERRYLLISMFEHHEISAGRLEDQEAAYKARFDQFINTPI